MSNTLRGIQVIVTAHKEGVLLYQTIKSAELAIKEAYSMHPTIEISKMIYLDNPDKLTLKIGNDIAKFLDWNVIVGDNKDPGQSRMKASEHSSFAHIALLDGDDLWSYNWLSNSIRVLEDYNFSNKIILHPEYNYIFEGANLLVRQGDPTSSSFDLEYFRFGNYWDALSIFDKSIFEICPYIKNNSEIGLGHEDFTWSQLTSLSNFEHQLVKGTIHFKRKRAESVSFEVNNIKSRAAITDFNYYKYFG